MFLLSVLLLLSILISCNTPSSKETALSHEQIIANASRSEKNGWIVIHLEGAPQVIGYQHGYLLADEIIDLRGAMEMLNEKTTGKNWDFYRNESYKMFWPKIPSEYREELNGISAGVNSKLGKDTIDTKDVVAMNSILEMAGYYVPWLENQENPFPPEHCSAFAATGSWTTDSNLAKKMQLWAIMGHPCGQPFIAKSFLDSHPEFNFQKEFLRDMPGQVWTLFP